MSSPRVVPADLDPRAAPARVLVIDDDATVRAMTRQLLAALGLDVVELGVPKTVSAYFSTMPPPAIDGLLIDVSMPQLSGPELVEELGSRILGIPLVFMTGESDPGLASELRRRYHAEVLHKPFTLRQLRAVLQCLALL